MRLILLDRRLFVRKTATVILATVALIPLASLKSGMPLGLYLGSLVVLHLFVLALYVYRVRFRELDPDWRSLAARVLAIGFVLYLLAAVEGFDAADSRRTMLLQAALAAGLHTFVLALLMVRVSYGPPEPTAVPSTVRAD